MARREELRERVYSKLVFRFAENSAHFVRLSFAARSRARRPPRWRSRPRTRCLMPDLPRDTPAAGCGPLRRRAGRPRLAADRLRSAALPPVRLTQAELGQVEELANTHGLSVSALVRRIVLGRRLPQPVPRVNLQAWAKLGPLAGNLNQYVKAINQGRAAGVPLPLLLEIRQLLDTLRDELRGRANDHGPERL